MAEKKVLFLSYPFPPAVSAGVFRSSRFVRYLPDYGWIPVVLTVELNERFQVDAVLRSYVPEGTVVATAPRWYPETVVRRALRRRRGAGVGSLRTTAGSHDPPTEDCRRKSKLRSAVGAVGRSCLSVPDEKIWWAIPALPRALKLVRQHRPSVILATAPPNSALILSVWVGLMSRLPVVLDLRDPWSLNPWERPTGSGDDLRLRINGFLERGCLARANAVVLNTNQSRQAYERRYERYYGKKFYTVYNGYDAGVMLPLDQKSEPGSDGRSFRLCHVGTVYGRRDIRPFLKAMATLIHSGHQVRFEQLGSVDVDYDLDALVNALGLAHCVEFRPPDSHDVALRVMGEADGLLLLQPDSPLQVPGKLFEMIRFRKPIVTLTGPGETRDIASKYTLGPVADAQDEQAIAAAIRSVLDGVEAKGPPDWEGAAKEFDGRQQVERLASILDGVFREKRRN